MPHRLSSLPKPSLEDDDPKALGLVLTYWAYAESSLESVMVSLAGSDATIWHEFKKQRLVSVSKKIEECKRLLKITCATTLPDYLKIGTALMTAGKLLSNRRKIVTHWNASAVRDDAGNLKINFADPGSVPFIPAQPVALKREEVLSLAADIAEWWIDLNQFWLAMMVDGPIASRTKWHGPKPGQGLPALSAFRSLQNLQTPNRRTPKRSKP